MDAVVYLNGEFIPAAEAKISPFDFGFLYGYGLYETFRSYSGIIFRLAQHLRRLQSSVEILGLGAGVVSLNLEKACLELLKVNRLQDARIRITISAGPGDISPDLNSCSTPTVFIAVKEHRLISPEVYQKGYQVFTASCRRNSRSFLAQIKSTCCLENILALQEAEARGGEDALILNEQDKLAEGSTANIFLVKDGGLITPSVASGALPGITGEVVRELAHSMGIDIVQREVPDHEIISAEEIFRTSSILEIMPITWINGHPISSAKPGPITNKIISAYRELVRRETGSK